MANIIKGRKGGSSKQRTPTEQPDDLQSIAKAKILVALGEGEFAGSLTGKDIYLDGTPIENADGSQNFSGVAWEFRPGTQAQNYIQGIPGTENEISVGTDISSQTAWTHTFTNTQLSAIRLRLKWSALFTQEDDGDLVGNTVKYAIDLQTDGGSWQTVVDTAVTGKTTSGYERSHRIDLPRAGATWTVRLRKITPDANSAKIGDNMALLSYTEVIDAKLRYPNTALLYIEFDSSQFNGSIPQISCEPRGRVIRVPDTYDPETRSYNGTWTGTFKWAWTDNPAWIFYDLVVTDRFGLGNRLTAANIDKWMLYQVAQYCDQLVPDGKGGDGLEPRYICNVYIQDRNAAYTVLRDFAAIFRGMTCWNGQQIIALADMPRDIDFTYTRANVIDGKFRYSSSTSKTRYTNALVSWSDPANAFSDAMEPSFVKELVARYGFNQLELTAIGCTRQSEAHRKGLWGILTNNKDRVVTFDVGLDGKIPQPGYVIGVADEMLAGKVNGGRISKVDGRVISLDRDIDANAGDRLQVNLPSGTSQSRTIQSINGRRQVTVTTAFSENPETESVWAIESDELFLQQYRVVGVKDNNNGTYTITGTSHDPDKYPRIDTGAIIDQRPVSIVPPGNQAPPDGILLTSFSVVNQGISVETLQANWEAVKNAIAYEAQWRRNDGNWINVPRSSTTSFEITGIYAGRYLVRVRAINAAEVSSGWAYSEEKTLTGKIGLPSAPIALTTTSLLHGVQLNWEFPAGTGDTQKTELQYSPNPNGNGAMLLSDVAYPGKTYQQMGLQIAAMFWYRARIVDRLGNESPWTDWVQGMASDDISAYYDQLTDAIKETPAWEEVQRDIEETHQQLTETADAISEDVARQISAVNQNIDETVTAINQQVDNQIDAVNKSIKENIDTVNQTLDDNISTVNQSIGAANEAIDAANDQITAVSKSLDEKIASVNKNIDDTVSDINAGIDQQIDDVNKAVAAGDDALKKQIQTAENGLKQSIAQANTGWDKAVRQETADRIADVNAKAAQAADQLLNERNDRVAAIDHLQTIMQDGDDSLARQISEISAGSGQQFDSFNIFYFDQGNEGWTEDDAGQIPMQITDDGWLKASNSTASCRSPNGQAIPASSYRTVMLRIKRVGNPTWKGKLYWIGVDETGWSESRAISIPDQEFDADGISVVAISDINWNASGTIRRFRLDLAQGQNADNYFLIHWISVGRPAPAASTAALRDEETARTNADEAEAQKRSTLAAQIRGSTDSNSLADLRSGLLYQEMNARITADAAEVTARESLQTQFNENKASVAEELSSISTAQSAQASKISGLETSLGKKADASALQSLTQKVEQQGTTLTSQGSTLTSLTNRIGKAESGVAANSNAITGLQSTVSQQGNTLTSQGSAITKLQNDLSVTNDTLGKKADAASVSSLTNRVDAAERSITSQSASITELNNSVTAAQLDADAGKNQPTNQLVNGSFERGFDGWRNDGWTTLAAQNPKSGKLILQAGKTTNNGTACDQDVTLTAGRSYRFGAWVRKSADFAISNQNNTKLSLRNAAGPVKDVPLPATDIAGGWTLFTGEHKASVDSTMVFSLRTSLSSGYLYLDDAFFIDITDEKTIAANASATSALTSRVESAEGQITSQGQQITQLNNSLTGKADASALQSLQNTVTQHGKTLTSQGDAITSLNNSLEGKADAGAVNSLTSRITEAEGKLSSQGSAITKLQNDLTTTNANVNKKADASALQSLQNTVTEQGNALTSQGQSITQLKNDLSTANGNIAKKADASALQTLQNTVTQQGKDITAANSAITKLTGDLSTTNANVSKKADASALSALQNTVTQQGNTLTSQGSSLTQLNNSLSATQNDVAALQNDAAAGVAVPGNMLVNSGFERGLASWTTLSGNYAVVDAAAPHSGAKILRTTTGDTAVGQLVDMKAGRTYKLGVFARCKAGTVISNQSNNKLRIGRTDGSIITDMQFKISDMDTGNIWTEFSRTYAPSSDARFEISIRTSASAGEQYFDDVYLVDVTDETNITANAGAISGLTSRVSNAEGAITSQSQSLTKLQNDLSTTNTNVDKKADASALQTLQNTVTLQGNTLASQGQSITSLQGSLSSANMEIAKKADASTVQTLQNTVTQQGKDITAANSAITKLNSDLSTTNANVSKKADAGAVSNLTSRVTEAEGKLSSQSESITSLNNTLNSVQADADASGKIPGNLIVNPSFERGTDGFIGLSAKSTVVEVQTPHSGTRALRIDTGSVAPGQNIDFVKDRTYEVGIWVKQVAGTTDNGAGNNKLRIGNSAGNPVLEIPYTGAGTNWTKYSKVWKATETASLPVTLNNYLTAGNRYFDDFYVIDVTDRINTEANTGAISQLQTTVTQHGNTLTSQGQSITKLQNDLSTANGNIAKKADATALQTLLNTVTQQGGTLDSQGQSITQLQNGLSSADANIAKKADGTAVTALTNRVTDAEGTITAQGAQLTMLKNSLAEGSLISNGGLNVDASFWDNSGSGSAFTYDAGEKALRTTTGSIRVANTTRIPVEAGTTLTLSFEMKSSEAIMSVSADTIGFITDLGNPIGWLVSQSPWLADVTTSWQTKSVELTIPDNFAGNFVYLRFAAGGWAPATSARLYLRNVDVFSSNGVAKKANASAVNDLTSRVDSAEGKLASQGQSITKLQNDLTSTNNDVSKKADQSALTSLTGRVEKTESGMTAANSNITSLTAAITAAKAAGDDLIPNPTFDPTYNQMGYNVVSTDAEGVPAGCPFKYAARLASRDHIPNMNNIVATAGDVIEFSALVACGTGTAAFNLYVSSSGSPTGGVSAANSGGSVSAAAGATWVRTTWRWTVTAAVAAKGFFRPFLQISQSAPFSTIWYATDWHCRNITAAAKAQATADATASAVDSLTTTVSQQGDTLSSIGNRTTALENGLSTTNANVSKKADASALQTLQNTVTQQGKDITAANSAITKLTGDLSTTNANVSKKADASALSALQNTVTQQGNTLTSQGSSLTQLNNSLSATQNDVAALQNDAAAGATVPGNMLVNSGFELGSKSWAVSGPATFSSASSPHSGGMIARCGVGKSTISQRIDVKAGRTYRVGVFARRNTAAATADQSYHKLRIGDTSGSIIYGANFITTDLPTSTTWVDVSGSWTAAADATVEAAIWTSLSAGEMYFDDVYVVDITDETKIAANAGAIGGLTSRVSNAEGTISSQGQSLTKLQNDLTTTNANVNKKADASALQTLQNTVTQQGNTLASQGQSITSLQGSLSSANTEIAKKADASAVNTLTNRVTQAENKLDSQGQSITSLNNSIAAVQQDADAAKAMPTNMLVNNSFERGFDGWRNNGWTTLSAQNPKSGKFIIQATTASGNGTECNQDVSMSAGRTYRVGAWVRKSGDFAASNPDNTKISIRNSSGPVKDLFLAGSDVGTSWTKVSTDYKPTADVTLTVSLRTSLSAGYLYIDDAFCLDVTDEVANSVNASAISALTTRVTNDEGKITSQGQSITSLQNSLGNKADVGAVNSLTTRVTQAEGKIESAATSLTSLNSTVGNLSSTVQAQGQTLADTNGKLNSMYSIKVETDNGKKVGAGIVLGSDGDTSDMILYADRFSLFNRNSKAAVPVMIAEGNELYIDSARIKNGSIDNAKIGDFICSSNYNWADGSTGWLISKDGACLFNNGRFRGTVYADGGEFNNVTIRENCNVLGTVQAAKIVGDVGAYGINIAQHRSRSIPKATWVWYDLMVVDRQPFAQRVQLVGALRQDDKINISGSGDFSAEPGYCILMRTAGATSGGGAMTCAISIDGILYAQEGDSMKVQSMDFVVPAGTGQTVVRYGYYLDRNGSMKGAILSRFHAFASRNSNIIRGASSD
ncbi:TPA: carbohydrate binding domain-containing protein [Raoultella ornithinolytica]